MAEAPPPVTDERWRRDIDRNGLIMLDRAECLRLLGTATLGRIGLTSGALPAVLPVNFWFDGQRIYIRTGPGTKLAAATRDSVVAFEVDDIDPLWHTGWSVMVTGLAHHVVDADELTRLEDMPIAHWAPKGGDHIISVTPELISGRRNAPGGTWSPGEEHHREPTAQRTG
jgi:hypothetical protein